MIATRPCAGARAFAARLFRRFEEKLALGLLAGAFAVMIAQSAFAHEFKAGQLEIEHPWSRATPAGAKVAGGYFAVSNEGTSPDRLVSATAEIAGRTEIHEMAVKDGIMTMRMLPDGVAVPAKGELVFKPGSYHLMFMELKRPIKEGERFPGTLTFEKAGTVAVEFAVESMGKTGDDHGSH